MARGAEPLPTTTRTDGQRTIPGEARRVASFTKHNGHTARLSISSKQPFDGYLLEKQEAVIAELGIVDQIAAGGLPGDMYLTLARLIVTRECFYDAMTWAASIPDMDAWRLYASDYKRWANQTTQLELKIQQMELESSDDMIIERAIERAKAGK